MRDSGPGRTLAAAAMALAALLLAAPGTAAASSPDASLPRFPRVERAEEERLVLLLRLKDRILAEGARGFQVPGGVLLSLDDLVAALDLPISIRPGEGTAKGWMIAESRRFSLDLPRGTVRIAGSPGPFDPGQVELHEDGIYADTRLLSRWFPVDLAVDLSELAIAITPREKLPLQRELERQARWDLAAGARESGDRGPRFDRLPQPYRLVDWPIVDSTSNATYSRSAGGSVQTTATESLLAEGDLLGTSAQLFLTAGARDGSMQGVEEIRLLLGRRDPGGGLLGPLGATSWRTGDLASPADLLVSRGPAGVGGEISSFPLVSEAEFDRITLRGDALPGWDVELYRNEVLLDFATVAGDGRYEFAAVPLLYGLNILRLDFYGPQGQRREKVERVYVGQGMPRPGELHYRAGAYRQGMSLFELEKDLPQDGGEPQIEGNRLFAGLERGLTRNLALRAAFLRLPLPDGDHDYSRLALRAASRWLDAEIEAVADARGGSAGQVQIRTRLLGTSLFARHLELSEFRSEQIREGDTARSVSELRLDGRVPLPGNHALPFGLDLRSRRTVTGAATLEIENRLSAQIRGLFLTNRLGLTRAGDTLTGAGSLLASGRLFDTSLRGSLSYGVEPDPGLTSVALTGERELWQSLRLILGASHTFTGNRGSTLTAGLNWERRNLTFGTNLLVTDAGDFQAGLTLAFNVSRDPLSGRFQMRAGSGARNGAVAARAFLDRDQNGFFGPGDEPLPGLELAVDGIRAGSPTDARGLTFLPLAPDRPVDVALRLESLEDPSWTPRREGVSLVPRPGRVSAVDFPVISTGEVDGTVWLLRGGDRKELANVRLQLLDSAGSVAAEARSQFDGFFLFEKVLPGRYRLRVDPEQAGRLGLQVPPPREIVLGSGEVVGGIELVLEKPAGALQSQTDGSRTQ